MHKKFLLAGLFLTASQAFGWSDQFNFTGKVLHLREASAQAELALTPAVKIGDHWFSPGADSDCLADNIRWQCSIAGQGTFFLVAEGDRLLMQFQALRPLTIQALGLQGALRMPGVKGWLSQGFQSWSQTGVVSLKKAPDTASLNKALALTGEDEVYRRGPELSWWYSFIGSDRLSFLAGASTADRLRSYIQFSSLSVDDYQVKLITGAGEQVALQAGEKIGESWYLGLGARLQEHLDRYAGTMESRRRLSPAKSLVGWNSWYDLWEDVTESEFSANLNLVQELWEPRIPQNAGPLTVTLDDGWEQKWGDWLPNSKFPLGMDELAQRVQAKGYRFGLWLAPLLVDPKSEVAKLHPDWLVQGASYRNPAGINFRVLDVTQPAVAEHLQNTIRRLVAWGVGALKIDFLFAGTLEGGRSKPITGMEAYHEALRLIREAAGEETLLFAVGAPPLATFKYVDGWRVGGDIAFKPAVLGLPRPATSFIANQARSVAGRQPYCQITLCDADPALLRTLSKDEVNAGVWVAAATGGAMVLSDDLMNLDRQRLNWGYDALQFKAGLSGQAARLQSYFPPEIPNELNSMKDRLFTAEQKVPEIWIMPDGTRVALNFGNGKKIIEGIEVPKNGSRVLRQ